MSLYADYIKERLGDEIIENETGFASYRYLNEKQVYIVDLYIRPAYRKQRAASALSDHIVEVARARGCSELIGTVVPSAKGSTESIKALLGYGLRLDSASQDLVIFKKDI